MKNINKTSRQSIRSGSNICLTAILISASLGLSGVKARADYRSKTYQSSVGNDWAGMTTTYGMEASNSSASGGSASANLNANCTVKLLKQSASAVDFKASASSNNGTKYANYSFKLAGATVESGTTTVTKRYSSPFPVVMGACGFKLELWDVGINLSGVAMAVVGVDCTFKLDGQEAGILGKAYVNPITTASAKVGVGVASVSLDAKLGLGNTSILSSVEATPTKLSGGVDLGFEAVNLVMDVKGHFGYGWLSWNPSYNLIDYQKGAYTWPLIRL